MNYDASNPNRRILIVDDSPTIQHDYKSILAPESAFAGLAAAELELFGEPRGPAELSYELEIAQQGEEAVEKVFASVQEGRPYSLAFVDVRMPPGIDGIEATEKMFKVDTRLHVVLCTAYSDHSWKTIINRLGQTDRLLILKKPFDAIEVRQMALALTTKWQHQLLDEQKRDEMQEWLNELTEMVGSAKGQTVATPAQAK
ncbi:MAG TPA: response regulator [Tepidisphaeraceae bacterium]|jgi:CheY-like chemotaxis protein|nr:response regulator [Tepidisphaeraceae bacterium]